MTTQNNQVIETDDNSEELDKLGSEISRLQITLNDKQSELDSIVEIPRLGADLLSEIQPIFPKINSCSYAETILHVDSSKAVVPTSLVVFGGSKSLSKEEEERVENWIKNRLKTDQVIIRF